MDGIHPLKNYRESQSPRLTKAALARELGVSRLTVHRWENGDREIGVNSLPKVSQVTGISKRELRPDLAEHMSEVAQ